MGAAEHAVGAAEVALEALRVLDDPVLWQVRWQDLEERVALGARALERALCGVGPHELGALEFRLANLVRALACSAPPLRQGARTRRALTARLPHVARKPTNRDA